MRNKYFRIWEKNVHVSIGDDACLVLLGDAAMVEHVFAVHYLRDGCFTMRVGAAFNCACSVAMLNVKKKLTLYRMTYCKPCKRLQKKQENKENKENKDKTNTRTGKSPCHQSSYPI